MVNHLKNKAKIALFLMPLLSTGLITEASLLNNQASQPTVNNRASIPSRAQELPVPADGNCLYNSLIIGYLLPAVKDKDLFKVRLTMLVGGDKVMPTSATNNDKYDDKKDDNKDDIKIDLSEMWDVSELRQSFLKLHKDTMVYMLRQKPFTRLIKEFRQHMGIGHRLWSGANEIKKIANKLQLTIKEYTPNPDDDNKSLTEPLTVQCDQGKPLHTLALSKTVLPRKKPITPMTIQACGRQKYCPPKMINTANTTVPYLSPYPILMKALTY